MAGLFVMRGYLICRLTVFNAIVEFLVGHFQWMTLPRETSFKTLLATHLLASLPLIDYLIVCLIQSRQVSYDFNLIAVLN